jgi:hypothetical protein
MKKALLAGALIGLALLLGGCVPMARNPISLILLILELTIQIIGAVGVIYAAYRRATSPSQPNHGSDVAGLNQLPARPPGNS